MGAFDLESPTAKRYWRVESLVYFHAVIVPIQRRAMAGEISTTFRK